MKRLILILVLGGFLFGGVLDLKNRITKKELQTILNSKEHLVGDIDGDGKDEIVTWKKSHTVELGDFYRVYVYKESGKLLWKSPDTKNDDNPYAFGSWDFGVSLPEVLIDTNGDNQVELLAPAPVSDVSPVYYRIFYWNGHSLVASCSSILAKLEKNYFYFINPCSSCDIAWVSQFKKAISKNVAEVEITKLDSDGKSLMGSAIIKFNVHGANIEKWIKPLSLVDYDEDFSTEGGREYIARIGRRDHYNSKGKRLYNLRAILRQDRANYYKGLGDSEDIAIGEFDTAKKRELFNSIEIEPKNLTTEELKREVIYNNPLLKIKVLPNKLEITNLSRSK